MSRFLPLFFLFFADFFINMGFSFRKIKFNFPSVTLFAKYSDIPAKRRYGNWNDGKGGRDRQTRETTKDEMEIKVSSPNSVQEGLNSNHRIRMPNYDKFGISSAVKVGDDQVTDSYKTLSNTLRDSKNSWENRGDGETRHRQLDRKIGVGNQKIRNSYERDESTPRKFVTASSSYGGRFPKDLETSRRDKFSYNSDRVNPQGWSNDEVEKERGDRRLVESRDRGENWRARDYGHDRDRGRSMEEPNKEPIYGYYEGDHIYGILPVKLALQAKRRKISELLVQEGLSFENKKDSRVVADILALAEAADVPVRWFSKHDLNMLTDSRPHQGFVLRASPLSFQSITHLPQSDEFK